MSVEYVATMFGTFFTFEYFSDMRSEC